MAITPRNIVCDGPDVFSQVAFIGIAPLNSSAEGAPIYTTLDAEVTVSGGYTDGDLVYDFAGTTAITQRTRAEIRADIGGVDVAGENAEIVRDNDVSSWVDFGYIVGAGSDIFMATQAETLGCNGGVPPFAPPAFELSNALVDYVDGTRTDTAEDPDLEEARSIELTVYPPYFTGSIQDGDLEMIVSLVVIVNVGNVDEYTETFNFATDCSAWTTSDFRDIRGTYGTTSTDINGIEYIWSVTIG